MKGGVAVAAELRSPLRGENGVITEDIELWLDGKH